MFHHQLMLNQWIMTLTFVVIWNLMLYVFVVKFLVMIRLFSQKTLNWMIVLVSKMVRKLLVKELIYLKVELII